jgi:hypothetical protein
LYAHATAALFVLSCAFVALLHAVLEPRERLRFFASYAIASLLTLMAYAPWLFRVTGQVRSFAGGFWATFPTTTRMAAELGPSFLFGHSPWRWLVVALLALGGSYVLRFRPRVLASLWLLTVLGPGLVLLVSVWQPMFMHRQFLWACVPFAVLVGAGLTVPAQVPARVALLAAALTAGAWALKAEYYEPYNKERWRETISFVRQRARPGDKIVAATHSVKLVLEYHFSRKTSPLKRFRYERAKDDAALSTASPRRGLWILSRRRQRGAIDARLATLGWVRVETKHLGKGIELTYHRATRRKPSFPRADATTLRDAVANGARRRRNLEVPDDPSGSDD